jgi:hypothetical protein
MRNLILSILLVLPGAACFSQYTTSWIGNTFGDNANHVGNCARSMWVSPGGIVYASSGWDENGRNIGIYQNGVTLGSMGGTNQSQGSAIAGDSTWVFAAQETPAYNIGRYNRATKSRDLLFQGSSTTTASGDVIRGLGILNGRVYVSDYAGNRIAVFTTGGTLVRQWPVTSPGALAIDSNGFVWVAQMISGTLLQFDTLGTAGAVIHMDTASRPSALYVDNQHGQLLVGDQGPDMNIKIYDGQSATLITTFGTLGGYLNQTSGIRGQTGDKRFTRIVGIGRDTQGRLYVLNNPWGGTWDLGRNGATDIHCYDSTGALQWTLQALNFEGVASADAGTDGADLYSGNILYHFTGTGGGNYVANTVDPYRYPGDARISPGDKGRGEHFGMMANAGGHRLLVAANQNTDVFYTYYFNPSTDGYIAIPGDTIQPHVRNGFQLDSIGDRWTSYDKTNAIQHYPLTGFTAGGRPIYGTAISTPTPTTIAPLNRLGYLPASDKMVLAGGSTDWTLIGNRIEVYNGWLAGNRTPNTVITLSRAQAKSMAVAGDYVFIGYYAIPNIDVFSLTTGNLILTLTPTGGVYAGNDTDSEYGVQAYHKSTGEYLITKDDYNGTKVVIYRWNPADTTLAPMSATKISAPATAASTALIYPNPVEKTLTVNLNKSLTNDLGVRIVDLSGKVVLTSRIKGSGLFSIATADLQNGIYILTIADAATGKKIAETKFIKK